jgi:phenylalanyl-tRNA synthetase beta chain
MNREITPIHASTPISIHDLTDGETESILSELDIKVIEKKDENWILSVPSYRVDVTRACDVSEEILRIYGFNNVPIPEKLNTSITTFPKPDLEKTHNTIADLLVDKGFVEVMNNSLTKSSYYSSNQEDSNSVSILNPLSQELGIMRKSLLFGILENLQYNQNRQQSNLKVFEFGKTYQKLDSWCCSCSAAVHIALPEFSINREVVPT